MYVNLFAFMYSINAYFKVI